MVNLSGQIINDRFRIVSKLSEGGFGLVYLAEQIDLDRKVVIKFLHAEYLQDAETIARFQREAKIIADFNHRNIVSCYGYGLHNNRMPYLVFELLRGRTLGELITTNGPINWRSAFDYGQQVCAGLSHAHACGVIHRDLKPENIFVTSCDTIKILDFGLAHVTNQRLTATGELLGTPLYISPEQIHGAVPLPQSDLYSLGCVLYHAIAGQPPFDSPDQLQLMSMHCNELPAPFPNSLEVPPEAAAVLFNCMAKEPSQRYGSALELCSELENAVTIPFRKENLTSNGQQIQVRNIYRDALFLIVIAMVSLAVVGALSLSSVQVSLISLSSTLVSPDTRSTYLEQCADKLTALKQTRTSSQLYALAASSFRGSDIDYIVILGKWIQAVQDCNGTDSATRLVIESLKSFAALKDGLRINARDADRLVNAMSANEKCILEQRRNQSLQELALKAYEKLTDLTVRNRHYKAWAWAFTRQLREYDYRGEQTDTWNLQSHHWQNATTDVFCNIMSIQTWSETDLKYHAITELLQEQCRELARNAPSNGGLRQVYLLMLAEAHRRGMNPDQWHSNLVALAYPWMTQGEINPYERKHMLTSVVSSISTYHWPMEELYRLLIASSREDVVSDSDYETLKESIHNYCIKDRQLQTKH